MGSSRYVLVAVISGVFGIACSSASEADDPVEDDRVRVDATDATREAIGVSSWGVSLGPTSAVVRGYDAKHARRVFFEYRVAKGENATFEATLDADGRRAALRVEAPDTSHVRVLEDSMADHATAKKILARVAADLRSQPARFAGAQSGLATRGIHVLDLVQGSNSLSTCAASLSATAAASGAETTNACSGGANAGCNEGMQQTTKSQSDGNKPCACTGEATAIAEAEVEISKTNAASGEEAARGYIGTALDALCIKDAPARENWTKGYLTLTNRESSWNPNAVNTTDSNATGPTAADGNPQKCSRGIAQAIPPTFAAHHQPGTSNNVYDPVASIAASMNYVIARYGVSRDGSNLAAQVAQANPNSGPRGY